MEIIHRFHLMVMEDNEPKIHKHNRKRKKSKQCFTFLSKRIKLVESVNCFK